MNQGACDPSDWKQDQVRNELLDPKQNSTGQTIRIESDGIEHYYVVSIFVPSIASDLFPRAVCRNPADCRNLWNWLLQFHQDSDCSGGAPPLALGLVSHREDDGFPYTPNAALEWRWHLGDDHGRLWPPADSSPQPSFAPQLGCQGWHTFILHVVWSTNASSGVIELWLDGELVLPAMHKATLWTWSQCPELKEPHLPGDVVNVFVKTGLYRTGRLKDPAVLYLSNYGIATTLEAASMMETIW